MRNERTSDELKIISNEEYYTDLQRVAKKIELNTVPYKEYKEYGNFSAENIINRFGKWNTALVQAGLEPTGFSKNKITKQQCFDEIERIWILLGRQPTSTDIIKRKISRYSIDTYKRRFGGWRKALEEFVNYINKVNKVTEETEAIYQAEKSENGIIVEKLVDKNTDKQHFNVLHKTSRNINMSIRFRILQRDNFKCCYCGASPAKDPSVILHVDHIIPWVRGGETVEDNLQTLCSKCNLGKSDLI